jgi:mono/diheme cytochrome c family protein
MCIGCHGIAGYQASFPEVHKVPMISGQNAKYITASLVAYKKGERKHPTMRAIADTHDRRRTWPTSGPSTSSTARAHRDGRRCTRQRSPRPRWPRC